MVEAQRRAVSLQAGRGRTEATRQPDVDASEENAALDLGDRGLRLVDAARILMCLVRSLSSW